MLPALFLASGTPELTAGFNVYTRFLQQLAAKLPRPAAAVVVSSQWESERTLVSGSLQHAALHDYYGYRSELYEREYRAPGSYPLALGIHELLEDDGIGCTVVDREGLDYGIWQLLAIMYPEPDFPVVPISVQPARVPEEYYRIGKALASLRNQNTLIITSGGTVRNLHKLDWEHGRAERWAVDFDEWLMEQIETWNLEALFEFESRAPHAADAVPETKHLLPLFAAMGACDVGRKARLLHRSYQYRTLSLSGWMFG